MPLTSTTQVFTISSGDPDNGSVVIQTMGPWLGPPVWNPYLPIIPNPINSEVAQIRKPIPRRTKTGSCLEP